MGDVCVAASGWERHGGSWGSLSLRRCLVGGRWDDLLDQTPAGEGLEVHFSQDRSLSLSPQGWVPVSPGLRSGAGGGAVLACPGAGPGLRAAINS